MADIIKAPVKVNENGVYVDVFPETYASIVRSQEDAPGTVRGELDDMKTETAVVKGIAEAAAVLIVSPTAPAAPNKNMIWVKP